MVCTIIRDADGKPCGFVCDRRPPKRCSCGRVVTKLCDFPLAGKKAGETCSKPLCDQCSVQVDPGTLPERFQAVAVEGDTFDLCRAHADFVERGSKNGN